MGHYSDSPCLDNDSWRRLLLLRSSEAQKCSVDDLAQHGLPSSRLIPGKPSSFVSTYCTVVSHTSCSGSFGGVCANDASRSDFAQYSVSRYSLAFSDTANRYIGDLRQFSSLPLCLVAERDHYLQATLASRMFFSNRPSGAR